MKKTFLALAATLALIVPLALVQLTSFAVAQVGGGIYGGPISAPGGTLTAPLLFPDGTQAAPSIAFSGDAGHGFYRSGTGSIYYVQNNAARMRFSTSNLGIASDGTYRWNSTTDMSSGAVDTGFSRLAAGVVGVGNGSSSSITGTIRATGVQIAKVAQTNTAPGAALLKLEVVAGTTGSSCRLIAYAGTSTTPVTVLDNIGSGC